MFSYLWYQSRYLILFRTFSGIGKINGEEYPSFTKIIFYDANKNKWKKCCYKLPFDTSSFMKSIRIKQSNGKHYLHFIGSRRHFQLKLCDMDWLLQKKFN